MSELTDIFSATCIECGKPAKGHVQRSLRESGFWYCREHFEQAASELRQRGTIIEISDRD